MKTLDKIFSFIVPGSIPVNNPTKEALAFYRQFFKDGDLVFDIGANIGDRTEIYKELGARVIAIEPQIECVKQLKRRYKNDSNVIIVNKAVDVSGGTRTINICSTEPKISTMSEEWKSNSRFSNNYKWDKTQIVETVSFDNLIEEYGMPAFVKIDVEGYELNVIKGLTKPVQAMSLEFTQEKFNNTVECIELMSKISTYKFNVSLGESMLLENNVWLTKDEFYDYMKNLFSGGTLLWGDIYLTLVV